MTRFIARFVLFVVVFWAGMFVLGAAAKPSRHEMDEFLGDRWLMAQRGTSPQDVIDAKRKPFKRKKWKPRPRQPGPGVVSPIIKKVIVIPVPRARPDDAPEPDEDEAVFNGTWNTIAVALNTLEAPRVLRLVPSQPINIYEGFAREIMRALPARGVSLAGVVPELVTLAGRLSEKCGSRVISARVGRERSRVRGSGRPSLHQTGHAIDVSGNPACMYALLRGWPGGVSNDYARIRPPHIHVSLKRGSGEWGRRFAHYRGGYKRTRYARVRTIGRMASR